MLLDTQVLAQAPSTNLDIQTNLGAQYWPRYPTLTQRPRVGSRTSATISSY